jgi:hypothetical protein
MIREGYDHVIIDLIQRFQVRINDFSRPKLQKESVNDVLDWKHQEACISSTP